MTAIVLVAGMLLAALLGLLVRPVPGLARAVGIGGSAFVAIVAMGGMVRTEVVETVRLPLLGPNLPGLDVPLHLVTSRQLATVGFIVAAVTLAVQVYAAWYLATDDRYGIFATTVSLFSAAMLLLVHSGDLVLTLVAWEVMGWCSYLLIGHWSRRAAPRRAALKSFLVTRLADVGFVLATIGLSVGAGSTAASRVIDYWSAGGACAGGACGSPSPNLRAVLLVLLIIGILGKSASFPFQDWLPDAMEGPTPASALIHAATMVAAGTVVLAHLFPVLAVSTPARWVLGIVAAVTMLGGAVLAFGQSDLKRLLAWSTVSQVAVMLAAVATSPAGVGADAGLFHLWAHAIFKALLFLALGWLAVIAGGTSARALRGAFHHAPPGLVWGTILGLVSLAGVPLFVGGLSKEHVLATAYADAVSGRGPGLVVLCALLLTVVVTAAYSMRCYLVLTAPLADPDAEPLGPATPPPAGVTWAIGGLSMLTVLGGLVLLSGVFDLVEAPLVWSLVTIVLIATGAGAAVVVRGDSDPAVQLLGARMAWWDHGFGADAAYLRSMVPVRGAAALAAFLDREVIDAYVRGGAVASRFAGELGARLHRAGRPVNAVALVVAGLLLVGAVGVFGWP